MSDIKVLQVTGMVCGGCEATIEDLLNPLEGVNSVKADYAKATVTIDFETDKITLEKLSQWLGDAGYPVIEAVETKLSHIILKVFLSLLALIAIIGLMFASRKLWHQFSLPDVETSLTNSMIFITGLITGLHCVGMCGAFVINYTAKDTEQGRNSYLSHLLYALGKTLSYSLFGALFGFIGSLISITAFIKGVSAIVAGGFLVIFGLNMLNVFAPLKRIRLTQPVSMIRFAVKQRKQAKSPFFIGFFTGFLLGCGPLQAMYVMAAGTSDPLQGAEILFFFGLGTLPALLGFGFIARLLTAQMTRRFLQTSGIILIFIGTMMLNKGLMRTQSGYDFMSLKHRVSQIISGEEPTPMPMDTQSMPMHH